VELKSSESLGFQKPMPTGTNDSKKGGCLKFMASSSLYPWPELHNKPEDEAKELCWPSSVREDEQSLLMQSRTSVRSGQFPPATTQFSHCDEVLCLLPQTSATWGLHYRLVKWMVSGTTSRFKEFLSTLAKKYWLCNF
jgi:hypothetical protein